MPDIVYVLSIGPQRGNWLPGNIVTYVENFEYAKSLILFAEKAEDPFDCLNIPKKPIFIRGFTEKKRVSVSEVERDARSGRDRGFYEFLDWMEKRKRRYPFAIYGISDEYEFTAIRDYCRERGFTFLD